MPRSLAIPFVSRPYGCRLLTMPTTAEEPKCLAAGPKNVSVRLLCATGLPPEIATSIIDPGKAPCLARDSGFAPQPVAHACCGRTRLAPWQGEHHGFCEGHVVVCASAPGFIVSLMTSAAVKVPVPLLPSIFSDHVPETCQLVPPDWTRSSMVPSK